MPLVSDTAYPRLEANPDAAEVARFTPTPVEIAFITSRTRQSGPRLALLILLKTFQRLGYFPPLGRVPAPIVAHLAREAGLADAIDTLVHYESSTYRSRLMALVRRFVGVTDFGRAARRVGVVAAIEAARVRENVADIINAVIEELVRQRFELPAFGTLLKIANAARAKVNRGYHRLVAGTLAPEVRERLNGLLILPAGQSRTVWDQVKTEPRRPTPQHMRDFLRHLDWLREQMAAEGLPVDEAALASLSPYQTEHINRFGNYVLDFARVPMPLPTEVRSASALKSEPGTIPEPEADRSSADV
jgi:Domain of unknown function (DUF4158)/Tn3 transposase DDE domain